MHIINILRAIWTRYGVGFNNLSRSEQVASGLKDSTGVDLPSLLNGLLAKPDTGIDPAESPAD